MFLFYSVTALHILVCIILVLVVLLQSGKGADLAGAFGGGATQTAFGSRGPASFLSKMTSIAAVIFMLTSIGLSMISTKTASRSVLEGVLEETAAPQPETKRPASDVPSLTPEQIQRMYEQELESQKGDPSTAPQATPDLQPETP